MVEKILHNNILLAIIVSHDFKEPGVHFFTPDNLSQQLAYMKHPSGKEIVPHIHNRIPREVQFTQEVLFIRRGKLRVDFYSENGDYLESRMLEAGDTILLTAGGHGFEVLEDLEMIEVKQGPHAGEGDKTRIEGVDKMSVKVRGRDFDRDKN
jgi:mannose-6-phosphate isomerase-like protein (cupin superfamily)